MHIAIRLSCIVALLFCLTSTGNAAAVNSDRQRLQELLRSSEQTTDPEARVQLTFETVQIYKKYRGSDHADLTKETELDAGVENFESKIELVEGVPKQGGGFSDFFSARWIPTQVRSDAVNLARSSSQALMEGIGKYLLNKLWSIIGL